MSGVQQLSTVVAALSASLSGTVTMDVRRQAGRFIEDLSGTQECLGAMLGVLSLPDGEADVAVKQLAMSILISWLKKWWNLLDDGSHNTIRQGVVTLLQQDLVSLSNSRALRTSLSVAIASIAERQYPQLWPTFVTDVLGVWQCSPLPRQEIVIAALEAIVTDCIDSDFNNNLPALRRQEIISGLKEQIDSLLGVAFASLGDNLAKLSRLEAARAVSLGAAPSSQQPEHSALVNVASVTVKLVRAIIQFKKAPEVCKEPHDFSLVALALLGVPNTPQLQKEAAQLLCSISQDKLPLDLFARLLQALPNTPVAGQGAEPDLSSVLEFQRFYAAGVYGILGENIAQAVDPSFLSADPAAQQVLGNYVSLMARLVRDSSHRVAAEVVKDWQRVFKEGAITQLPWMADVVTLVLTVYLGKAMRGVWVDGVASDPQDAAEFEELVDYIDFTSKFHAALRELVALIANKFPDLAAAFAASKISLLLQQTHSAGAGGKDSQAAREWDALLLFLSVIFKGIPPSSMADARISPHLTAALDAVLAWLVPPGDSFPARMRVKTLAAAFPLLKQSTQYLGAVLQALLAQMANGCSSAASVVAQLCEKCASEIILGEGGLGASLLPQLASALQHPTLTLHEKASLRESLVALSEVVPDPAQRTNLLSVALGEAVGNWKARVAGGLFASPQNLLETSFNGGAGSGLSQTITLLNGLLTASKRVAPPRLPDEVWTQGLAFSLEELNSVLPFLPVWIEVLPGVIQAAAALHAAWAPAFRQKQETVAGIFRPSAHELSRLLHSSNPLPATSSQAGAGSGAGPSVPEGALEAVRRELLELRSSLYQLLGQACVHKVLYLSPDAQACLSDVVSASPHMENQHLAMLFARLVEPLVLHAPPMAYTHVSQFLTVLLHDSLSRLAVAWDQGQGQGPGHGQGQAGAGSIAAAVYSVDTSDVLVYRHCGLPASSAPSSPSAPSNGGGLEVSSSSSSVADNQSYGHMNAEEVEFAKERIIGEMTKSFSDLLGALGMSRSFLSASVSTDSKVAQGLAATSSSTSSSSSSSSSSASASSSSSSSSALPSTDGAAAANGGSVDEQQRERQKAARRLALASLILGGNQLTRYFVEGVVALICLPVADACKTGLLLGKLLLERSLVDARFLEPVGRDAFCAALSVLLKAEKYAVGLEWSLIDFMHDVYSSFVLGFPLGDVPVAPLVPQVLTDLPRQMLLLVPGNTPSNVQALEESMRTGASKRKRRDMFKEHVASFISKGDASQQEQVLSGVLDIRSRLFARPKQQSASSASLLDGSSFEAGLLSRLFE